MSEKLKNFSAVTQSQTNYPSAQVKKELSNYITEITAFVPPLNSLVYWKERHLQYPTLSQYTINIITALASQAFVERIFSLCGILCEGKNNRMQKNLPMRVFLKLNKHFLNNLDNHRN